MSTPTKTVTTFLTECGKGKEEMQQAFRTYFHNGTVWENVGMATTTGVDEALRFLESFEASSGATHFDVDTLSICATGNRVLTERVDRMLTAGKNPLMTIRLMGIFVVENGKISAWRDYFDTAPFKS